MGTFRFAWYGVLALGLAACNDPLVVTNLNQPDRGRVFSNATDLEQFVSALCCGCWRIRARSARCWAEGRTTRSSRSSR